MNVSLLSNFASENELAVVLGHFSPDYITTIVQTNLANRLRVYGAKIPNAVYSLEQDFKLTSGQYPDSVTQVEFTRAETYSNILNLITSYYNLSYTPQEGVDLFTITHLTYGLLVSDFANNFINFFSDFIIREFDSLYNTIISRVESSDLKDSTTLYSKKVYANNKLAILSANLDLVLNIIGGTDISFDQYVHMVYSYNTSIADFITANIKDNGNFFNMISKELYGDNRPELIASIRINLLSKLDRSNRFIDITV